MTITLGALTLPAGLRWEDEFSWSAIREEIEATTTGALVIEPHTLQAGRPITLIGGRSYAWMTRVNLIALLAALDIADAELTLTMHDARQFQVRARHDGDRSPVEAFPLPVIRDSGPPDPQADHYYWIERIALMEI